LFDDLSDREALERHMSVNLFGTYAVIQAFLPSLIASGGDIVDNVSIAALAPIPVTPARPGKTTQRQTTEGRSHDRA
jgi:NAD(P)-dependent dehydrogenase (short-subunit alcohol dehydrogenase family)